ncbi:hypothetical protein T484DRAFT_1785297 [Baffinella frigidus]|nr:hypothetical protein T484DRAFT_1785297 [Cryptophyta sp. CCMP2293]
MLPLVAIALFTLPSFLIGYQTGHRNVPGAIIPPSHRLQKNPGGSPPSSALAVVEGGAAVEGGGWDDGYNEQGNCSRAYRPGAAPKAPPAFPWKLRRNTVRVLGMGFGTTSTRSGETTLT